MIKSRKKSVAPRIPADSCALGLAMVSLTALNVARAAAPEPQPQVMQGVSVTEEVDEGGYKAEALSSPKFTAPLLDTPQTITVIRRELLDDQGLGSLAEALRNTPGITFTLGENGNSTAGDSITMRGFDTSGSIFVDGVRDMGAVSRDTFNTEQVEIVKGPSGADNGRGAPTGYINLSSKQPTLEDAASAKLALGNDSRRRAELDVNQTLAAWDGAALRFNTFYDGGDRPDRDVADFGRWGFAPALALGLGGETRAYFNYLFVKQNNTPDGGLPTIGILGYASNSPIPEVAEAVNAAPRVDRHNYYGAPGDFEHVRTSMFTARLEHDFSSTTTLRNTARYGRNTLRRVITGINTLGNLSTGSDDDIVVNDPAEWTISRSRQGRDEVNELLTNQSNLTTSFATGGVTHSVSTGVEFIYERQRNRTMAGTGTALVANLYNPSTADVFQAVEHTGALTDGKTVTAAVYVFDNLQFSEQWSLNTGLRLDRYRTESAGMAAPATPPVASTYLEGEGTLVTGKVGLVFKPVENGSLYAAIGTSEQPPGGANFALNAGETNINNPNLQPQKARNVEIGTKWDLLDNRLVVTAAAFDTRNRNDLATQDTTGEITQLGERKVRGVELGVSGMITPAWQVTAGFASMDTKVVEGTAATTGAQLTFSPKFTFTSWTTYRLPFGLTVGGGARYTDSQLRNGNAAQPATALVANPDAWVIDAMAGYDISDRISLQLNVQNLLDRFHLNSLNNGGSRFVLGTPRSFLLTGAVKFY